MVENSGIYPLIVGPILMNYVITTFEDTTKTKSPKFLQNHFKSYYSLEVKLDPHGPKLYNHNYSALEQSWAVPLTTIATTLMSGVELAQVSFHYSRNLHNSHQILY